MENPKKETPPPQADAPEPAVLAVASVETKGTNKIGEDMGGFWAGGIAQD